MLHLKERDDTETIRQVAPVKANSLYQLTAKEIEWKQQATLNRSRSRSNDRLIADESLDIGNLEECLGSDSDSDESMEHAIRT